MQPVPAQYEDILVKVPDVLKALLVASIVLGTSLAIGANAALPAFLVWSGLMAAITVVDFEQLRVPNKLVGAAALVMFPLLAIAMSADLEEISLLRAIYGAFALFGGYLVLHLISPSSLGMGDVKLAFVIGGHLGFFSWAALYWSTLAAFGAMAVVGLTLMAFRRAGRKSHLPFGPFMIYGAIATLWLVT